MTCFLNSQVVIDTWEMATLCLGDVKSQEIKTAIMANCPLASIDPHPVRQVLMFLVDRCMNIQGSTNRRALGLVNFVPALAYHFCLNLPAAFTQPGARILVEPCTSVLVPLDNRSIRLVKVSLFQRSNLCISSIEEEVGNSNEKQEE